METHVVRIWTWQGQPNREKPDLRSRLVQPSSLPPLIPSEPARPLLNSGRDAFRAGTRRVSLYPLILVDQVFVDVESSRRRGKAWSPAQPHYRGFGILARRINPDKLHVFLALLQGMHVLQHVDLRHVPPPDCLYYAAVAGDALHLRAQPGTGRLTPQMG